MLEADGKRIHRLSTKKYVEVSKWFRLIVSKIEKWWK